jgi:hypothetical protein
VKLLAWPKSKPSNPANALRGTRFTKSRSRASKAAIENDQGTAMLRICTCDLLLESRISMAKFRALARGGRGPRWPLGRWNSLIKEEIATDHHQPCRVRITCEENALQKRIGIWLNLATSKLRPLLPGALIRGRKMHRHQGDGVGPCTSNRRTLQRTVTFQNATKIYLPRYEKVRRVGRFFRLRSAETQESVWQNKQMHFADGSAQNQSDAANPSKTC